MYDEDFVNEDVVEFIIDEKKFSYKPVTAGEENDWINEYIIMGEDGKSKPDFSKLNKCKVRNIKKVPYDKETIRKFIGLELEWSSLNNDQKWDLFKKLHPTMFDKIFQAIAKIDKLDVVKKKDSIEPSNTVTQNKAL